MVIKRSQPPHLTILSLFWQLLKVWFHPDPLPPFVTMSLNMTFFFLSPSLIVEGGFKILNIKRTVNIAANGERYNNATLSRLQLSGVWKYQFDQLTFLKMLLYLPFASLINFWFSNSVSDVSREYNFQKYENGFWKLKQKSSFRISHTKILKSEQIMNYYSYLKSLKWNG